MRTLLACIVLVALMLAAVRAGCRRPVPCTAIGCRSGVQLVAHLDAPLDRVARSSFTVCHRDKCWSGSFKPENALSSPPSYGCTADVGYCAIEPEGDGAVVRFFVRSADGQYRDGDRIELRITVDGKPLVDHVRFLQAYEDFSPNGRLCGPTCEVAAVEIWPSSPNGQRCPSNVRRSFVRFERIVPMNGLATGPTEIIGCRDGVCSHGGFDVRRWDDSRGHMLGAGPFAIGTDGARGSVDVDYDFTRERGYRLGVTFSGDARGFAPGDRFSIDWHTLDGRVLMKGERVVEQYDESQPGGPACTPVPGRHASFRL